MQHKYGCAGKTKTSISVSSHCLEDAELLLIGTDSTWLNRDDVEVNGLAKWPAFTNLDDISLLNNESWAAVSWDLSVPLLETLVLSDPVEVISPDDDGPLHLCRNDNTPHKAAPDRDGASEWALAVDVLAILGGLWSNDTQTDVLCVAGLLLAGSILLRGQANLWLLLECALSLDFSHC